MPEMKSMAEAIKDVTLRRATAEDASFVNELTRRVMRPYVEATWERIEEREHYYKINLFQMPTTSIIQLNGTDVGRVSITRNDDLIVIDEIHILSEYQGKGIGSAVFQTVLDEGRKKNLPVELFLLKVNPSKKLYERLGFHVYREDKERFYMKTIGGKTSFPAACCSALRLARRRTVSAREFRLML